MALPSFRSSYFGIMLLFTAIDGFICLAMALPFATALCVPWSRVRSLFRPSRLFETRRLDVTVSVHRATGHSLVARLASENPESGWSALGLTPGDAAKR